MYWCYRCHDAFRHLAYGDNESFQTATLVYIYGPDDGGSASD